MAPERRVLVTDGDQRAALAVVRSLGRAGYRCIVCSSSGRSLAGASRFVEDERRTPDPAVDSPGFVRAVEQLVQAYRIDLLIPISEVSLLAILPAREQFTARIPFPSLETFRSVCDKALVLDAAQTIGIRTPRQRVIASLDDGEELVGDLPLVLKPHASVVAVRNGARAKVGVSWVGSEKQLLHALRSYPTSAFPVLAQEVIKGPGIGIFLLMHEGVLIASFAHRRLREKPPGGGVSVVCQSEPIDRQLLEQSVLLLRQFDWSGAAMVEYKQDEATGEAVLMEINGRFWGSLQLAIDAEVDFPRLLAALSFGDAVQSDGGYRQVRNRWFWGDVDHLLARLREPGDDLRTRLSAVVGWVRAFGPDYRSEILRWEDPRPFFRETALWVAQLSRG